MVSGLVPTLPIWHSPNNPPNIFGSGVELRASIFLSPHCPPPAVQFNGLPAARPTSDAAQSGLAQTARSPGARTRHEACGGTNIVSASVRGGRSLYGRMSASP